MDESQVAMLKKLGEDFQISIDVDVVSKMTEKEVESYLKLKEGELFDRLFKS